MSLTGYPGRPAGARRRLDRRHRGRALPRHRHRRARCCSARSTGAGTMVDVAMLDCQLAILENALTTHLVTGARPGTARHAPSEHRAVPGVRGRRRPPLVVCAGHDASSRRSVRRDRPPRADRTTRASAPPTIAGGTSTRSTTSSRRRPRARVPRPSGSSALERRRRAVRAGQHGRRRGAHPAGGARHMIVDIADPAIGRSSSPATRSRWRRSRAARAPAPPDLDADRAAILAWLDARSARA